MKLWIDDDAYTVRKPPGDDWLVACSSAEAIYLLEKHEFDFIAFDHDLGADDKAMKVVDYLCDKFYKEGKKFAFEYKIHSCNPVGAKELEIALDRLFEVMQNNEAK